MDAVGSVLLADRDGSAVVAESEVAMAVLGVGFLDSGDLTVSVLLNGDVDGADVTVVAESVAAVP